jgi:hypothetical protein
MSFSTSIVFISANKNTPKSWRVQNQSKPLIGLGLGCGGTIRVQHLWQTVRPSLTEEAIATVDGLTEEAIKTLLGKTELSEEAKTQSFMPVRFAGLGYRSSEDMASAAYIGGFTLASFGIGGIGDIKPEL